MLKILKNKDQKFIRLPIVGAEVLTSSAISNPEDNLIDTLKDFAPTEEAFNTVQKAIFAEELSLEDEQKAKLFLGDMVAAGFVLPFAIFQKTYRMAKEFNTKPMSSLSRKGTDIGPKNGRVRGASTLAASTLPKEKKKEKTK